MDLDSPLCFCFHISKRKIVNFVKRTRPRRASQISECFGAGTGCGWCIPFLKRIHVGVVAGDIVEAEDVTADEYEAMRRDYLEGIRDGTRTRNDLETEGPPKELQELDGGRREMLAAWEAQGATHDGTSSRDDADDDWDVSDYFSSPPPPDPEPDDLKEMYPEE